MHEDDDIREKYENIMLIPEKVKEVEMMSMRTDNKFVEHKRDVDGIDRRLKRLEELQGQSTSI